MLFDLQRLSVALTSSDDSAGRRNAVALAILMVIWIVILWDAFDPSRSFALYMDNEFFIGAVLSAMSGAFAVGDWPLRMATALGGLPVYNFTQLSPLYPFYFAPLPLFETPLEAAMAMHWITVLHILLFAVNMFIMLRVTGTTRLAAVTGASLVAFGANSLAYAGWVQIVAPYAWLPFYVAGLIGVLENRSSKKYPAMAVAGMVLLTLASPSQPLIHATLLTGIFALFRCWHNHKKQIQSATRIGLFKLCGIAMIAFLLSAPAILPATLEFSNMIRWLGPQTTVTGFDRMPFEAFLTDQLTVAELGGVLVKLAPKSVGSPFAGPIAVTLAIFAFISRERSWIALAMAAVAIYALVSSAGSNLGLAYLNYVLPLVNKIREPSRFLFLFQFAIGILAAFGIDELRKIVSGAPPNSAWRRLAALVVSIALVSLVVAFALRGKGAVLAPAFVASGLLLVLMALAFFAARTRFQLRGEVVGMCWSAAALSILAMNVNWNPPPLAKSHYLKNDGPALDMAIKRVADLDPRHEFRLIFEGSLDKQIASMLASYQNVRTLSAYFNPAPLRQFQELYHHGPRTDSYLQILGARYLLCRDCAEEEYRGFRFRETVHGYDLHEANNALPYAQVAQRVDGRFDSLADFIGKTVNHDLSRGLLFIEADETVAIDRAASASEDCIVREDIRKNNRIRYLVSCRSAGVLILNEFYAGPWRVAVNDVASDVLRVNGNQIGVEVSPGNQAIEFSYRPGSFLLSIALAAIGVAMALLWALWPRRETQF